MERMPLALERGFVVSAYAPKEPNHKPADTPLQNTNDGVSFRNCVSGNAYA